MFDGVVQVSFLLHSHLLFTNLVQSAIIFFLLFYAYRFNTARSDGFDVAMYEFSTVRDIICYHFLRFHCIILDYGRCCSRCRKSFQWTLHECLDGFGVFRCRARHCACLGIYSRSHLFIASFIKRLVYRPSILSYLLGGSRHRYMAMIIIYSDHHTFGLASSSQFPFRSHRATFGRHTDSSSLLMTSIYYVGYARSTKTWILRN
jgi:hypothetical protein